MKLHWNFAMRHEAAIDRPAQLGRAFLPCAFVVCLMLLGSAYGQTVRPVIRYANRMGGSGSETVSAITTDQAGNVYITGTTGSTDFPNAKRLAPAPSSPDVRYRDVFVTKIDPTGATTVYSVLIGQGKPSAIAVDADGAVYVAGADSTPEFPATPGAASTAGHCFLLKLDPSGSRLTYSTKLGCSYAASIWPGGLTVDSEGNAFVAGQGSGIPTTPGAYRANGGGPFAMKINAQGSEFVYATYLPAVDDRATAEPQAIVTDTQGNAYLTGSADSRGFPATLDTLPAERPADGHPPGYDVFLLKLSADGSQVVFSTLFGGVGDDRGSAIALDEEGFIYISGISHRSSGSPSVAPFPTTEGAFDVLPGSPRGFLAKLTPGGDAFVFSTFLPDADEGICLSVSKAGIDVLTTQQWTSVTPYLHGSGLLRMSLDGGTLLRTTIAGTGYEPLCGRSGERFALTNSEQSPTSPDLVPIGSGGESDIFFTAVDADVAEAPKLEVNAGAIELRGRQAADGSAPPGVVNIHAETGTRSLPIRVVPVSSFRELEAAPVLGMTPFDTTLSLQQGSDDGSFFLFAPGAQDGLVMLPATMRQRPVRVVFDPESYHYGPGVVRLAVDNPDAPPVTGKLRISSVAESDIFSTLVAAPMDFRLAPESEMPSWLTMTANTGTTPTEVEFTANGAGLSPGTRSATFQLRWAAYPLWMDPLAKFTVTFLVGEAPPQSPRLNLTQQSVSFHLTEEKPTGTATLHLESSGDPLSFAIDPIPDWLSITPASGTTPADLTVTAAPATLANASEQVQFRSSGRPIGGFRVNVVVAPPGFVGVMSMFPMSSQPSFVLPFPKDLASGALCFLSLNWEMPAPDEPEDADPASLPFSLAGYSFQLAGSPIPVRAYKDRQFLLQLPSGIKPGWYELEAVDAKGARAGTAPVEVSAARPQYLEGLVNGGFARKEDGSVVNAENPVHPGERMLIRLTGQGAVSPALPDGQAASAEVPSKPVLPVTAYTGTKPIQIVSATMSTSEAGVLDVWMEVPNLYDGDHYITIKVGPLSAGVIPLRVTAAQ